MAHRRACAGPHDPKGPAGPPGRRLLRRQGARLAPPDADHRRRDLGVGRPRTVPARRDDDRACSRTRSAGSSGSRTAAASLDSPLGRLRSPRARRPDVDRDGAVLEARGDGLALAGVVRRRRQADPDDLHAVAAANPLRTLAEMREQRTRVSASSSGCSSTAAGGASARPAGSRLARGRRAAPSTTSTPTNRWSSASTSAARGQRPPSSAACARDDGRVDVALVEVWQGTDAVLKATAYIERPRSPPAAPSARSSSTRCGSPVRSPAPGARPRPDAGRMAAVRDAHDALLRAPPRPGHRTAPTPPRRRRARPPRRQRRSEADARAAGGWSSPPKPPRSTRVIALAMAAERAAAPVPEAKFHGWL